MSNSKRIMRVLKQSDMDAIVAIDTAAFRRERRDYFVRKFAEVMNPRHNINTSIVCEIDGKIAGFIMGDIYFGEYGIPEASATIDTLGVNPEFQQRGIASEMLDQFMMNMKVAGVESITTLVNWDEFAIAKFFARNKFVPSKRINLEFQMP